MAIAVSEAWKKAMQGSRRFLFKADMTLKDGTVVPIVNKDIMHGTVKFEDSTSDSGKFEIGSAIINQLGFSLNNYDDTFSEYDFEGATFLPFIGLQLPDTVEWIQRGKFTVVDSKSPGSLITISGQDDMRKFDTEADFTLLTFPCTLEDMVQKAAEVCGVSVSENALGNFGASFTIDTAPTDKMTWREIVSYAAQICCKNARMNNEGMLVFTWYAPKNPDAETDEEKYDVISRLASQDITNKDVEITGVNVESYNSSSEKEVLNYTYGTSGYVLSVYNNPLIKSDKVEEIATHIGEQIVGMTFRPLDISALSDPSIEAGDIVQIVDKKGKTHTTCMTTCNYTMGGYETFSCGAQTAERQAVTRYAEKEKTQEKVEKDYSYLEDQYNDLSGRMDDFESQSFASPAVTNLVMASDHFVVTFEDKSVKTYGYSVDADGLITGITLMG